jgi:hypothetical protein
LRRYRKEYLAARQGFLNCRLNGATLVPTVRKPFDVLAEGLLSENSRGDCPSFEPWITEFVDAALWPDDESVARILRLSA